jgi:hypothetical protein
VRARPEPPARDAAENREYPECDDYSSHDVHWPDGLPLGTSFTLS